MVLPQQDQQRPQQDQAPQHYQQQHALTKHQHHAQLTQQQDVLHTEQDALQGPPSNIPGSTAGQVLQPGDVLPCSRLPPSRSAAHNQLGISISHNAPQMHQVQATPTAASAAAEAAAVLAAYVASAGAAGQEGP